MPKSRFFRVAVEGATSDGRVIERGSLLEMAASYNPETYAARVNMEHIRGVTAEPPFQALGDVLALKTEEITLDIGGKQEKRLALFAEIDALEPLVAINRKKQKLFTSIEISPNFAATGKAYLVGLAITDSPASLGTEMLEFCQKQGDKSPLASRKQDPANLFTAALETEIVIADVVDPASADPTGIFASIKGMIDKMTGTAAPKVVEPSPVVAEPVADASAITALATMMGQIATTLQSFMADRTAADTAFRAEFATLKAEIEKTPASGFTARPLATGGDNAARTDC